MEDTIGVINRKIKKNMTEYLEDGDKTKMDTILRLAKNRERILESKVYRKE